MRKIVKLLAVLTVFVFSACNLNRGDSIHEEGTSIPEERENSTNIFNFSLDTHFDPTEYGVVRKARESKLVPEDCQLVFNAAKRIERVGNLTGYRISEVSELLGAPSSRRMIADCEGQIIEEFRYGVVDSRYQPFGCSFVAIAENGLVTVFCLSYALE